MRTASGIPYWRTYPSVVAYCKSCGWTTGAATSKGHVGAAAKHAKDNGHVVSCDVARTVVFGEEEPARG